MSVEVLQLMLQGWLEKEKRSPSLFGSPTNLRWFAIEFMKDSFDLHYGTSNIDTCEARDNSDSELILSYYKQPSEKRCGWIFLSDVEAVHEESAIERWITIIHPARTFRVRAPDHHQHNSWYHALSSLCDKTKRNEAKDGSMDEAHTSTSSQIIIPRGLETNPRQGSVDDEGLLHNADDTEMKFLRKMTGKKWEANDKILQDMTSPPTESKPRHHYTTQRTEFGQYGCENHTTVCKRLERAILSETEKVNDATDDDHEHLMLVEDVKTDVVVIDDSDDDSSFEIEPPEHANARGNMRKEKERQVLNIKSDSSKSKTMDYSNASSGSECSFLPDENFVNEHWDEDD